MWQDWSSKAYLCTSHGMELTRSLPCSAPKDDGDLFKLTRGGGGCFHAHISACQLLSFYQSIMIIPRNNARDARSPHCQACGCDGEELARDLEHKGSFEHAAGAAAHCFITPPGSCPGGSYSCWELQPHYLKQEDDARSWDPLGSFFIPPCS